jgi:hypothetical protein
VLRILIVGWRDLTLRLRVGLDRRMEIAEKSKIGDYTQINIDSCLSKGTLKEICLSELDAVGSWNYSR